MNVTGYVRVIACSLCVSGYRVCCRRVVESRGVGWNVGECYCSWTCVVRNGVGCNADKGV